MSISHSFTFRRKYDDVTKLDEKGKPTKVPYGDHIEEVTSGPNKGEKVPCFLVETDLVPATPEELIEQLEGEENFVKLMKLTFETFILEEVRKYFNKLKVSNPSAEQTEQGRADVIARVKEIGKRFTVQSLFTEMLNATSVTESLNSPEMKELALTNQAEFTRRAMELLARLK
jgi:hypothetical protein